jgi:electron transfer flavoprotein alpha subunit
MPECLELSKYSVDKVLKVNNDKLSGFTAKPMLMSSNKLLKRIKLVLLSSTTDSIYLSSLVAVALEAGYASNVVGLPSRQLLSEKRTAFSNKAFNITLKLKLKYLDLQKTHTGFSKLLQHLPKRILILLLVTMILV